MKAQKFPHQTRTTTAPRCNYLFADSRRCRMLRHHSSDELCLFHHREFTHLKFAEEPRRRTGLSRWTIPESHQHQSSPRQNLRRRSHRTHAPPRCQHSRLYRPTPPANHRRQKIHPRQRPPRLSRLHQRHQLPLRTPQAPTNPRIKTPRHGFCRRRTSVYPEERRARPP